MLKIYISGCEPSGDAIGAKLALALRSKCDCNIIGLGGQKMKQAGVVIENDNDSLSVMGFFDVLPNLRRIAKIAKAELVRIENFAPDIVITIDSFGYHRRLVSNLQGLRPKTRFIHYVAPQVWAHKPKRKHLLKKYFDQVLCILPFELSIYHDIDFPATYCGFPAWEGLASAASDIELAALGIDAQKPILAVMPGSRPAEVKRLIRVFAKAAIEVAHKHGFQIVVPTFAQYKDLVTKHFGNEAIIIDADRKDVIARSKLALIKSGTSSMELVKLGIPHVVCFKSNALAVMIAKLLIKLKYVSLANIVLDKPVIEELIQNFDSVDLVLAIERCINNHHFQVEEFKTVVKLFETPHKPSDMAANCVLGINDF